MNTINIIVVSHMDEIIELKGNRRNFARKNIQLHNIFTNHNIQQLIQLGNYKTVE